MLFFSLIHWILFCSVIGTENPSIIPHKTPICNIYHYHDTEHGRIMMEIDALYYFTTLSEESLKASNRSKWKTKIENKVRESELFEPSLIYLLTIPVLLRIIFSSKNVQSHRTFADCSLIQE